MSVKSFVYAVEILTVKRESFGSSRGLMFGTTRIQKPGHLDEFFDTQAEAAAWMSEWLSCHRGEARIAEFRVQGSGYPVAQTNASLEAGKLWQAELWGYTPDLSMFDENAKVGIAK